MGDTDIVMQGPVYSNTYEVACEYADLDFVNEVIISTHIAESDNIPKGSPHPNVKWVLTPLPDQFGAGNMNLQIITSMIGIQACTADTVIKMRSDQHIFSDSMKMMRRFYEKFHRPDPFWTYEGDPGGPSGPIFVIGMLKPFPYHPQDHVFWGHREDLLDLYDCPFIPQVAYGEKTDQLNYVTGNDIRPNIWLGGHYYARFNHEIYHHLNNIEEYLLDVSPKREEAMELYNINRDAIFKVFPRLEMYWIKYNTGYWYHEYEPQGEYYHDEPWEEDVEADGSV